MSCDLNASRSGILSRETSRLCFQQLRSFLAMFFHALSFTHCHSVLVYLSGVYMHATNPHFTYTIPTNIYVPNTHTPPSLAHLEDKSIDCTGLTGGGNSSTACFFLHFSRSFRRNRRASPSSPWQSSSYTNSTWRHTTSSSNSVCLQNKSRHWNILLSLLSFCNMATFHDLRLKLCVVIYMCTIACTHTHTLLLCPKYYTWIIMDIWNYHIPKFVNDPY